MIHCDSETLQSANRLILLAFEEDLQDVGDITSAATIPAAKRADVKVVAREEGVLSGGILLDRVYRALEKRQNLPEHSVSTDLHLSDGEAVSHGSVIATVSGPVSLLLTGERIALNLLIHLSGVASKTAEFVSRTAGSGAVILDTRKTLPGYRLLQKYAVRCGGGTNHRMGLFDGMLIKDNHLAARENSSVADAVTSARTFLTRQGLDVPVEVEVDTIEQLADALASKPEIVLLDNMTTAELQEAIRLRDARSPETLLEASGGVTLESVGCIAGTGVDRISIGGLTHSAPALDIGYDWSF